MKKFAEYFSKHVTQLVALIAVVVCLFTFIGWKFGSKGATIESTTTKLTFENIGELATQSAYCTQVDVIDKDQKVFNFSIPLTETKQIFSYNVIVKAGYNFEEITYDVDEDKKTILVHLPEVKILSTEVDNDSFKVYHEQNSAFTRVSLEETNKSQTKMKEEAQKNAIANGLYDNARENAETLLTGYFAGAFNLDEYKISFDQAETSTK